MSLEYLDQDPFDYFFLYETQDRTDTLQFAKALLPFSQWFLGILFQYEHILTCVGNKLKNFGIKMYNFIFVCIKMIREKVVVG